MSARGRNPARSDTLVASWVSAMALVHLGRTREALGHYEQALRIKPDSPEVHAGWAWVLATLAPAEGGDSLLTIRPLGRDHEVTVPLQVHGSHDSPDQLRRVLVPAAESSTADDRGFRGREFPGRADRPAVLRGGEEHLAQIRQRRTSHDHRGAP